VNLTFKPAASHSLVKSVGVENLPKTPISIKILKAVSSPTRLQILNFLFERGPLSYTEMMNILRLNPTRDAGRFAYHLKTLLKTNLIEPDAETKKYRLTDLGRMMLNVSDEIEEKAFRRKKMLVRTSRFSIEEFDRNKIVESLIREAGMPVDLAHKIARAAEKRLQAFKAKYLTAPLIREVVNSILLEKRLEEYRHKLTRLGLPVHDVTNLIKLLSEQSKNVETVHRAAGKAVMEEYTLLNVLPRDIADAHTSGSLHLENLAYWILKPDIFMHDVRVFFKNGLNSELFNVFSLSLPPPKNFGNALAILLNLTQMGLNETISEQCFDYFNVFLAPFIRDLSREEIKSKLKDFLVSLNQTFNHEGELARVCFGIELEVPDFLKAQQAVGKKGQTEGVYGDYGEECLLLASVLLELMTEMNTWKPLFNPCPIIKIRSKNLNEEQKSLLLKAHALAAENGLPCFANLCAKNRKYASFAANGFVVKADWHGDWELDTLRTSCLGNVVINLPRIAYKANGDLPVFWNLLNEQLEMASRALEIKYRMVRARLNEGLLPFLSQKTDGDAYLRLGSTARLIRYVGLNETVNSLTGKNLFEDDETLALAEKIASHISRYAEKASKKPETRLLSTIGSNLDVARRFAELDAEQYGWAKVKPAGGRENAYYTETTVIPSHVEVPFEKALNIEAQIRKNLGCEGLLPIQLPNKNVSAQTLASLTKKIIEHFHIGFFTYNRNLTYCRSCGKTHYGILQKCPECSSTNALTFFSRISTRYRALTPKNRVSLFVAKSRKAFYIDLPAA